MTKYPGLNEDFTDVLQLLEQHQVRYLIVGAQAIDGVSFDEAWASKVRATVDAIELPVLGCDALLANKLAAARPKDLLDVEALGEEK